MKAEGCKQKGKSMTNEVREWRRVEDKEQRRCWSLLEGIEG
jgi:hypothetical protein